MPKAAPARKRPVTPLAESFTHRLHTLQKLTDKVTQDAYLAATGLPLGEGRCLLLCGVTLCGVALRGFGGAGGAGQGLTGGRWVPTF